MESYRKYSSRHHDSRHHKHHKHRHRHHHSSRYKDEDDYRVHHHQRHHYHRSSDEEVEYEYSRVPRVEKPPSPMYIQPVRRPSTPPPPPPPPPPPEPVTPTNEMPKERNWKLISDPFLAQVSTKIYRYEGVVPNDSSYPEVIVQDPRTYKSKSKTVTLPIELTVPKFRVCILINQLSITIFITHCLPMV